MEESNGVKRCEEESDPATPLQANQDGDEPEAPRPELEQVPAEVVS